MKSKITISLTIILASLITSFAAKANSAQGCGTKAKDGFGKRFYETYKEHLSSTAEQLAPTPSIGSAPAIGEADTSTSPLMEAIYCSENGQKIKDSRIKFYGWADVGGNISTANSHYDMVSGSGGNSPSGYYNYANQIILNQAVFNLELLPDTVQTKKISYGFHIATLYGTDYQYTIASHFVSNQLIKDHKKYGFDPMLVYGDVYVPYVAKGLNIRIGRYATLQDIESTFAPGNYTYGHSMLNIYDPYTHQGALATLKLNKNWKAQFEIFNGSDTAINDKRNSRLSLGTCIRWDSDSGNDSIYPCVSGLNGGKYAYNNLQMYSANWYHKFNGQWSMATQAYHMWQDRVPNANNASSAPAIAGTRTAQCNSADATCKSSSTAAAHYLVYQFKPKDFLTLRNDFFKDIHGQRTGYNTLYSSHTIGWTHWIGDVITLRPELRLDHSYNTKSYNNGTKSSQYIAAADMVIHF